MANKKVRNWSNNTWWYSASYSEACYQMFRNQIINLALARFRWVNLPHLADARYLEWCLLYQGFASIAYPVGYTPNEMVTLQMIQQSTPNAYGNPSKWRAMGDNGKAFDCTPNNGVVVYDNMARTPMIDIVEIYAREMADILKTRRVNRVHVKTPIVFKGPREQKQQMANIYKQIDNGEPALVFTDAISSVEMDTVGNSAKIVPFYGEELSTDLENVWHMVYKAFGIQANPFKAERQTNEEITEYGQASDLMVLSPLSCRRQACEYLNKTFDLDVQVYLNSDIESSTYNFVNNAQAIADAGVEDNLIDEGALDGTMGAGNANV